MVLGAAGGACCRRTASRATTRWPASRPPPPRTCCAPTASRTSPDIIVGSFYDPDLEEGCAFEELISFHGGLAARRRGPSCCTRAHLAAPGEPLVGAAAVHGLLRDGGRRCSPRPASGPAPPSAPGPEPFARRRRARATASAGAPFPGAGTAGGDTPQGGLAPRPARVRRSSGWSSSLRRVGVPRAHPPDPAGVFDDLPRELGYDDGAPVWWPLPVLAFAGLVTALAIVRLPGTGGHDPAEGLNAGTTQPVELPGRHPRGARDDRARPRAGSRGAADRPRLGLGILAVRLVRKDAPEQLTALVAAAGSFAAISFIFGSPLIGAVILIEAAGLDRRGLRVVLPSGCSRRGSARWSRSAWGPGPASARATTRSARSRCPPFARPDLDRLRSGRSRSRSRSRWSRSRSSASPARCSPSRGGARTCDSRSPGSRSPASRSCSPRRPTRTRLRALLGPGRAGRPRRGRGRWSVGALALLIAFKGAGLEHLARGLPRRPDVPRPAPRRRRRPAGRRTCRA